MMLEDIYFEIVIFKFEEVWVLFDKLMEKKVLVDELSIVGVLNNIKECIYRK